MENKRIQYPGYLEVPRGTEVPLDNMIESNILSYLNLSPRGRNSLRAFSLYNCYCITKSNPPTISSWY